MEGSKVVVVSRLAERSLADPMSTVEDGRFEETQCRWPSATKHRSLSIAVAGVARFLTSRSVVLGSRD